MLGALVLLLASKGLMRESVMVEPWCKPTIGHVPIGTALHHTKGARFIIGIPPGPSIAPLPPPCISFLPCLLWAFPATRLAEASISLPFAALCHVCVSLLFNASHHFLLLLKCARPLWHVVRESVVAPSLPLFFSGLASPLQTKHKRYASSLLCCLAVLAPCVLVCV